MSDKWNWKKEQHWADIHRSALMLDPTTTKGVTRSRLVRNISRGHVKQIRRGVYRLTRQPR